MCIYSCISQRVDIAVLANVLNSCIGQRVEINFSTVEIYVKIIKNWKKSRISTVENNIRIENNKL